MIQIVTSRISPYTPVYPGRSCISPYIPLISLYLPTYPSSTHTQHPTHIPVSHIYIPEYPPYPPIHAPTYQYISIMLCPWIPPYIPQRYPVYRHHCISCVSPYIYPYILSVIPYIPVYPRISLVLWLHLAHGGWGEGRAHGGWGEG